MKLETSTFCSDIRVPLVACSVLLLTLATTAAQAQPVEWTTSDGGNGHWYELVTVPGGIDWAGAQASATARGGYLATLTSDSENAFAFDLANAVPSAWLVIGGQFGEVAGPWLGAFQPAGSPEPDGNWTWNNNEGLLTTPGYTTHWQLASPNNSAGIENRLQFYGLSFQRMALWNDINDAAPMLGYVVEWNTAPVPELGTVTLLLGGLAAMSCLIRRSKRT
jgi:hypothetical protein